MQISCKSDIGRMRSQNQDSVFASDKPVGKLPNLLIVADGMGGHKAGDFAVPLCSREIGGMHQRIRL